MSTVASLSELFPDTSAGNKIKNNPSELGQEDFMTLLVTQLENQDPTKPMDNLQFISQLAQFGTVSGIQELQQSFGDLSSALYSGQVLQASSLVGKQVTTGSNLALLESADGVSGTIELPANATSVNLYVQDVNGRLVYSRALGPAAAGNFQVNWDGLDEDGNALPAGQYRLSAEGYINGQNSALVVNAHNRVDSVTVGGDGTGVLLNLADGNQVSLSQVSSFR
ncbi:MAG: flagellar hook assembly protein FlgD [Porticoccaceae bacterium]